MLDLPSEGSSIQPPLMQTSLPQIFMHTLNGLPAPCVEIRNRLPSIQIQVPECAELGNVNILTLSIQGGGLSLFGYSRSSPAVSRTRSKAILLVH